MKKIPLSSISSIVCIILCALLIRLDMRIIASVSGLAAYFFSTAGVKKESRVWQMFLLILAAGILGRALSVEGHYLVISMISLALIATIRLLFFEKLAHIVMPWIEPVLGVIALFCYVYGSLNARVEWISWVFAFPPLFWGIFQVFGRLMEYREFLSTVNTPFFAEAGKAAPLFSLPDQDGNMVNLSDYKGKRHVLLIFVRGDWCPTCHIMLRTYEKYKNKFSEKNILIIAIGPDPIGVNRQMVINLGLDYKLLSDEKLEASKKYVMKPFANNPVTKYAEGIPLPAAFLVDSNGTIVYTSNPHNAGEILSPDKIFDVVATLH